MGRPLWIEVMHRPGTSLVSAVCCGVWALLRSRGLGYADVGLNYERVIQQKEYWRIVSSQLSHVELLHLIFNISALWSFGFLEEGSGPGRGTAHYIQTSVLLLILSGLGCLAACHFLIFVLKKEEYLRVNAVGYSCVVFGWMAIISASPGMASQGYNFFGLVNVPTLLAPFGSLVLTSVLIPRASFVGHLTGILAGYIIAAGAFDWLTPWWAISLLGGAIAGLVWTMVKQGTLTLPFLRVQAAPDLETGLVAPAHIAGGVGIRLGNQ